MWDWQIESELDRLLGIHDHRMNYNQLATSAKEHHESITDAPYTQLVEAVQVEKKASKEEGKGASDDKLKRDLEIVKLAQERLKLLKL